jgi:magnesium transporter
MAGDTHARCAPAEDNRSAMPNTSGIACADSRSRPERSIWVDLVNPTPDEAARVATEYRVHVPSRESLQEVETSSRVRAEGQVLYVNMPLAIQDASAGFAPVPLGFILSPELLVTVRYSDVHAFAKVKAQVEKDPHMSSAAVFVALIDGMVDFAADMLETSSNSLAALSANAFGRTVASPVVRRKRMTHALRESLNVVGGAGDQLSRIRESLLGLQRIVGFVSEMAVAWLPPELKTHLKAAQLDLTSLVDFQAHLSGKTQFLLDAILGLINTEQNEIFKVLTIVSVVGIPPTLIASMYGMNFHNMPELAWRWGYLYGLALIALSTLLPILWFRRRGWW